MRVFHCDLEEWTWLFIGSYLETESRVLTMVNKLSLEKYLTCLYRHFIAPLLDFEIIVES